MDDKDIIGGCRRGGGDAWESLFKKYYARLLNYAYRILRDRDDAEEAVQAALVDACADFIKGFVPDNLQAWLLWKTRNECLKIIAKRKRTPQPLTVVDNQPDISRPAPDAWSPDFEDAVMKLPEDFQEVIWLRFQCNCTFQEIAVILKCSKSHVHELLADAARLLGSFMDPDYDRNYLHFKVVGPRKSDLRISLVPGGQTKILEYKLKLLNNSVPRALIEAALNRLDASPGRPEIMFASARGDPNGSQLCFPLKDAFALSIHVQVPETVTPGPHEATVTLVALDAEGHELQINGDKRLDIPLKLETTVADD